MTRLLPLVPALLLSGSAFADNVYRWKDAAGVDHYTNDLNTIPTNVAVVPTTGGDISEISTNGKDAQKASDRKAAGPAQDPQQRKLDAEARRAEAEARMAEAQARREETQNEEQWRSLFRASRERVSSIEAELERARGVVGDYSGVPVTSRFVNGQPCPVGSFCGPQVYLPDPLFERARLRLGELERQLKVAREEHNDLERRASFAAVPRHWRQ